MLRTAECVTPKHPDKMCDQISDAILDHCLKQDPNARVAVEVLGGHGKMSIIGEITSTADLNDAVIKDIAWRITGDYNLEIAITIAMQSPDIAKGVDAGGAGDQGIMVGYACSGNPEKIPQELYLARSLCKWLYERYPVDGKTQVTIDADGKIKTLVASFQGVEQKELYDGVLVWYLNEDAGAETDEEKKKAIEILANPAGDWEIGGFDSDTGLTGRKLVVDNYGPQIPIGGGAFSGKDPSKVDRSAAYAARKWAIDLLAEHTAACTGVTEVITKIAYAIGRAEPVMAEALMVVAGGKIIRCTPTEMKLASLTPTAIRANLNLNRPIYEETAKWGHFGNQFVWDIPYNEAGGGGNGDA